MLVSLFLKKLLGRAKMMQVMVAGDGCRYIGGHYSVTTAGCDSCLDVITTTVATAVMTSGRLSRRFGLLSRQLLRHSVVTGGLNSCHNGLSRQVV